MWLIDTGTYKLKAVPGPGIHPYAILSHTWQGAHEVTFQEFQWADGDIDNPRFSKIKSTCDEAAKKGLGYAWVDTCCIDKTSSAELTEAINSMFWWYQESAIRFVYFGNLPENTVNDIRGELEWRHLAWFRRGWTLQELIAPRVVEFYDKSW